MNVLSILKELEEFEAIEESQLQWLIDRGEIIELDEGEHLFKPGDPIDKLLIILKGKVILKVQQGNQFRVVSTFAEKSLSGLLPYSRADKAMGYGVATLPTTILRLDKKHFREMITDHESLTTALVHTMSSRIRQFTRFEHQNDKMMALGKLSAGLAHELNNPSAAVIRSAQSLGHHLRQFPEIFRKVIKAKLTDQQVNSVNEVLTSRLNGYRQALASGSASGSMMERSRKEDELLDWLEDYDLDNPEATTENLVTFKFELDDLEKIGDAVSAKNMADVMSWIDQILTTERLVGEIRDASERINKLVLSVKNYTHMDQAPEKQTVDIHEGLESTLTMLNHKIKKADVTVIRDYQENLKKINVLVSEMNQVWTNLIDNAIDAMEEAEPRILTLKTSQDGQYIYVSICDTGAGIPKEIQDKIFDPFFTTKTVGRGTGLGMEVVRQIVYQQHNGSVTFESRPGKTDFKICLPIE